MSSLVGFARVWTAAVSSYPGLLLSLYTEMLEIKTYCLTLGASSSAEARTMRGK